MIHKQQNPLLGRLAAECDNISVIYGDFRSLESGDLRIRERRMLTIGMFFLARCNLSAEPCVIRWTMCTNAVVTIVGKEQILLEQSGEKLLLKVAS